MQLQISAELCLPLFSSIQEVEETLSERKLQTLANPKCEQKHDKFLFLFIFSIKTNITMNMYGI